MSKGGQQPFQQFIVNIKQKSCSEVSVGIKDMYRCSDRYYESKPHQESPRRTKGNKGYPFAFIRLGPSFFVRAAQKPHENAQTPFMGSKKELMGTSIIGGLGASLIHLDKNSPLQVPCHCSL
jgi:hypothetical protein